MLVYANHFTTQPDKKAFARVLRAVGGWLARKTNMVVKPDNMVDGFSRHLPDGSDVVVHAAGSESQYPILTAITYSHRDLAVPGRKWFVRVGIRQDTTESGCFVSVVLETSDISTKVGRERVHTSRPGVVSEIIKICGLADDSPSSSVQILSLAGADTLLKEIDDPRRRHVIIIVSPEPFSEKPLLDPKKLADLVVGLGEVYQILNKKEVPMLTQALGIEKCPFGGAAIVLYPRRASSAYVPRHLLSARLIHSHQQDGEPVEDYVLYSMTHRLNLLKARKEITREQVRLHSTALQLKKAHEAAKSQESTAQLLQLYDESNRQLQDEVQKVKGENVQLYDLLQEAEDETERLRQKCEGLEHHLNRKTGSLVEVDDEPPRQFDSLEDVAQAVEAEMADSILLTKNARKSMADSPYNSPANVYEAFRVLHEFFPVMFSGNLPMKTVNEELEKHGIEYSPHMSDTTMSVSHDYDARYKGRKADFNKHLKIGTSRKPERAFRIHFEWDEDEKKIVIHHAGRHLETQST